MKFGWVTVLATIGTTTSKSSPNFQIGIAHHHHLVCWVYLWFKNTMCCAQWNFYVFGAVCFVKMVTIVTRRGGVWWWSLKSRVIIRNDFCIRCVCQGFAGNPHNISYDVLYASIENCQRCTLGLGGSCELWKLGFLWQFSSFFFFDCCGFKLYSSFMLTHLCGSNSYKFLYSLMSAMRCTFTQCEWRLYFHTALAPSLQRWHLRGTLVHGLLAADLPAVVIESLAAFGHQDCWESTYFVLFLPLPFMRWIKQGLPTFNQNLQGLFVYLTTGSCKMWVLIVLNKLLGFTDG